MIVKVTFEPTTGVGLLTALVTERSAEPVGTGVSVSVSSLGSGSGVPEVTVAVLAYGPLAFTLATIVSVAFAPLARLPGKTVIPLYLQKPSATILSFYIISRRWTFLTWY